MSDSRSAVGFDRLPWLADEPSTKPARPPKRGGRDLTAWAVAAVLLIAGTSYWLGSRSETAAPPAGEQTKIAPPSATLPLPPPSQQVRIAPQPQVSPAPAPQVRAAPAPEVRSEQQRAVRLTRSELAEATRLADEIRVARKLAPPVAETPEPSAPAKTQAAPAPAPAPVARGEPLRPWQPRVVAGAAGRLVQIGAFGSVPQAKRGWWFMVRAYPAVGHLPAVVRPDRNSKGRIFYRFRVGTTSQAHSEVLCQRMEKIHLSCAVVGLPWKAKVER